ncbi:AbrB/MazE/SpoVT family DNA-binding domain-containing protein [Nanoarchaeota archaeon]
MKRKIVQLAAATKVVSLPAKWLRSHNIKKGDEIDMQILEDRILINSKRHLISKKTIIDISNLNRDLTWRYLGSAYMRGVDEIEIKCNEGQKKLISKIVKTFIGFIILNEDKNKILIKDTAATLDVEFEAILRRAYRMIRNLLDHIIDNYDNQNYEQLLKSKRMDNDISDHILYCLRILNKKGYDATAKTIELHNTLRMLELLSDKFADVGMSLGEGKIKKENNIKKLIKDLISLYDDFYITFYNYNQDKIINLSNIQNNLIKKTDELIKNSNYKKIILLQNIRESASLLFNLIEIQIALNVA